jgi:hypothetical protein
MRGRVNGELVPEFGADLLLNRCSVCSMTGLFVGEERVVLEDKEGRGTWKL